MEKKTSEAQKKASRKWEEKNKEKHKHDNYIRIARSIIRNHATKEELKEFKKIIEEKINEQ